MNGRLAMLWVLGVALSACTGPVNDETTPGMPTGYLCEILGPDYLALPSERRAIYAELERRQAQCPVYDARPVYTPAPPQPIDPQIFMNRRSFTQPQPLFQQTTCRRGIGGSVNCQTY